MDVFHMFPYMYPSHINKYKSKVEMTCFIYSTMCFFIYLYGIKKKIYIS